MRVVFEYSTRNTYVAMKHRWLGFMELNEGSLLGDVGKGLNLYVVVGYG